MNKAVLITGALAAMAGVGLFVLMRSEPEPEPAPAAVGRDPGQKRPPPGG